MTNEQKIAELRRNIAALERAIVKLQIDMLFEEDQVRKDRLTKMIRNFANGLAKDKAELDSLV